MSQVYVCAGSCHGQAGEPGNCQADACEQHGRALVEMNQCDKCGVIYHNDETHYCIVKP
ncbi:MAG: hypothetical protein WCV88_03020 [Patescibacteria group bacterium]|jgi:hypothetical protein